MFCQKCGKEINDEAVVCVGCGCPVQNAKNTPVENSPSNSPRESNSTANCALIFAFLLPIVGLIVGIVGACKYKTPSLKQRCITAIVISVIVWIVSFAIMASL